MFHIDAYILKGYCSDTVLLHVFYYSYPTFLKERGVSQHNCIRAKTCLHGGHGSSVKGHHLTFIKPDIHIFTGPSRTAANTCLDPMPGYRPTHALEKTPRSNLK